MVKWLVVATIAGLAVGAIAIWLIGPERKLTVEDLNQVKIGMARAEVHKVLRKPEIPMGIPRPEQMHWNDDDYRVSLRVTFDSDDCVVEVNRMPFMKTGCWPEPTPSHLERFRQWIGI